ncbi:MAG: hypothetical protein CMG57_08475 [Candidatus Marinimicrobia bacterium]|nr:hypothetical protein [Candidatus Neomarinimicrobiota bacterium]
MKKNILIILILVAMTFAERANTNRIGTEAAISNWSLVGPIDSEDIHSEILNLILENGIGDDSVFIHDGKNYIIKDATTSGEFNFIGQLYNDLKENDYVIGVAEVFSTKNTEIAILNAFYQTKSQLVYLNGEEIHKQYEQSKGIFRKKIKKGRNQLIVSLKNSDHFGFGFFMVDEKRVEMTFQFIDKSGNPIPFAGFQIRGNDYFETGGTADLNGYAERAFRLRSDSEDFILYVNGREDRYASKIINNIKPGSRKNYKITVGKIPSIEGKVLSLDGKNPQPGTRIRANLIGDKRGLPMNITNTSLDGSYKFENLPFGNYELFVSYPDKDYYLNDKKGKRKIFDISPSKQNYLNADFKTPTPDRGKWENVDYLDGLLSNWVSDILIDDDNNIWFACWTGISIFNGIEMKSLTPKDGLPTRPINKLFKDSKGNIWAGASTSKRSDLGLVKIDPEMNITPYYFSEDVPIQGVVAIAEDEYGRLIFGSSAGLTILDGENFTNYNYSDGVGNGSVRSLLLEGNNMWIGTQNGLVFYNGKKFKNYNIYDGLPSNVINSIVKSPKGEIWIATNNGLSIYDGMSFKNSSILKGLNTRQVNDIYFDENSDILVSTNRGISKLREDGTFYTLDPVRAGDDKWLANMFTMAKSKDGMYWFAGWQYGAWKYDPSSIRNLTVNDSIPLSLKSRMIVDPEKTLWVGTNGQGIYEIKNEKLKKIYTMQDGLRSNNVKDISMDNYGNLWIATNRGISMFNGKIFKNYTESDGMPSENVDGICVDKNGIVWFLTSKGLTSFDGNDFTTYGKKEGVNIGGWNNDNDIVSNIDGSIVIGQYGAGVMIFKDGIAKTLIEEDGLTDPRAHDIDVDSEGNIWIATDGGGVFKYDGKSMEHFDVEDGLASSETFHVYVDDYDRVWVGTFGAGVAFYDGEVWGSLDIRDGLIGNTINGITSISGQKFFFCTSRGISQYTPTNNAGLVNISSVTTPKNKYFIDKNNDEEISTQTDYRIRFSFNAANYNTIQQKQKYRYRIIGDDEKWSKPFTGNEMDWIPKNSGDYEFQIQAIDRDLNYSPPKGVKFSVVLPWYLNPPTSIPFWGLIGLLFYMSGFTTNKYIKQRQLSAKLREESQKKDREARERLEEKNSELLESQKAAEAANEAKSTFLANMSHELRTPLNAIIGYSEMLIEDAEDENEDFIPDLDKINSSGKHLLGLINDILDLSKVESGKMELYIEEFSLKKVIDEIEATIKPLVEKNSNTIIVDYKTEITTMKADITKIRQILLNLLSNASKFTKEGNITIGIKNSTSINDAIDFVVSDTGIGMTKAQVSKVFQPFTQADEKTTRKFGGTGLGLTITKMFSEMMGGEIGLKSEEGKGTSFTVSIPVNVVEEKVESDRLNQEVITDSNYTILVIDDDANAQDMMKKFLEKQDYLIIQARNGDEGLQLAAKHKPDLITLDVMMPEMDGWEVLAALQANDVTKNIPVIMLTMADEPDIGYSLGATDYLTKPVDWERLSEILKNHEIESGSQSILIVEDDETTRDMLKKSLENNEYKVRTANNGKEGLEKVRQGKPGLVLLDLMMPEMDGFEFSERLRENKEWLDIPVVVITAKDLTKEDHARLKGNVETIMQKGSYSKKELMTEVSEKIKKLKMG